IRHDRYSTQSPPSAMGGLGESLLPLAAAVAAEDARWGELAELVPDHVLGDVQLDELLSVVDLEVLADELGDDRAVASPGADRLTLVGALIALHLGQQPLIDVGPFLQRTTHCPNLVRC